MTRLDRLWDDFIAPVVGEDPVADPCGGLVFLGRCSGAVAEWCNDAYDASYYARSPADTPRGPESGELYVVRGGSWSSSARSLRAAARGRDRPGLGDA